MVRYFDTFNEVINSVEFKLMYSKADNNFRLVDLQGANLADIESDTFDNLIEVIDRLDVYINDYFIEDVISEMNIGSYEHYEDLIRIIKSNERASEFVFDVEVLEMLCALDDISEFKDIELILKNVTLEII